MIRLGHASLLILWRGMVIHVDPYSAVCDYSTQPQADMVLITHHHADHFDAQAIEQVSKRDTAVVASALVAACVPGAQALSNGDTMMWNGVGVRAVPAYNILQMRHPGEPFHIPGEGNGYLLELSGLRIYVAGDTELIAEMHHLGVVDIAFLPKNLPYTMSDPMFVQAAEVIRPSFLYPYHYDDLDFHALRRQLPTEVVLR